MEDDQSIYTCTDSRSNALKAKDFGGLHTSARFYELNNMVRILHISLSLHHEVFDIITQFNYTLRSDDFDLLYTIQDRRK